MGVPPDAGVLLLSALIILATHYVGAITGYGSTLLALPLVVWVVSDLKTCVIALLIVGTVQAYQVAIYTFRDVDWPELRRVTIWAGIGLPIGFVSMNYLPQRWLLLALGAVLVASGASRLGRGPAKAPSPPSLILNALLFVGGVIHGAFTCGGATLAVYAQYALVTKEKMRGTLTMIWVILNTVMIGNAIAHRLVTAPVGRLSAAALPFLLLGNWLGDRTARKMRQEAFTRLVALLLVIAGAITILRVVR